MRKTWKDMLSLAVAGLCTVAICEVATARYTFADVYLDMRRTMSGLLADAADQPERRPRDLMMNGKPISFAPYTSERPVAVVLEDYLAGLRERTTPAVPKRVEGMLPEIMAQAVENANRMIQPKVARLGDGTAFVTQFFDGDGNAARDHLLAQMTAKAGQNARIAGITVMMRRPNGAPTTEIVASQFDDVLAMLSAFGKDADASRLPDYLQPPAGARLIADLGDRGAGILSRTIMTASQRSPEQWSVERRQALESQGFMLDVPTGGHGSTLSFGARRGAVEADIDYVLSGRTGETTELIKLRQPGLDGSGAAGPGSEGYTP